MCLGSWTNGGKQSDSRQHFVESGEKHLLKQSLITIQTQHLHGLFEFWCYPAISNSGDVVGRTEETKTKSKLKHRSTVTIAHLNIRSLKNTDHYILAKDLVLKHKLDIFTISESWLDDTVTDLEVQFPGYTVFRLDQGQRNGGGVSAFINSNFKCSQLNELSYITESGFHQLWFAQREFVEEQIRQNPNNTRSIWKTIRLCIPKQPMNAKSFTKDDQTVANEFNKFFSSVGKSMTEKIQLLASKFNYVSALDTFSLRNYPVSDQFFFTMVERSQVKRIVNSIPNNEAPRIYKVPPLVLKESLPTIVPCIVSIINASFESGVFPGSWKTAEVFPILKNGDHEEANNYRPISLLPILSKIWERVALNQLTSYLTTNQRISTKQSGNKRWHSTETTLISTTDFILRAIDQKTITAVVYLDMSKAFDTINHVILLKKLKDISFCTPMVWKLSLSKKSSGPHQLYYVIDYQ